MKYRIGITELYTEFAPPGDTDFIHALRKELASIGIEIID